MNTNPPTGSAPAAPAPGTVVASTTAIPSPPATTGAPAPTVPPATSNATTAPNPPPPATGAPAPAAPALPETRPAPRRRGMSGTRIVGILAAVAVVAIILLVLFGGGYADRGVKTAAAALDQMKRENTAAIEKMEREHQRQRDEDAKALEDLRKQIASPPAPAPSTGAPVVALPPGGSVSTPMPVAPSPGTPVVETVTPLPATPQGILPPTSIGFHPAPPERRFLVPAPPEIANGNPDGSIAVQCTPDAGIIYPRPQGPHHTKEAIIAAAKRQGLEGLVLATQGVGLDRYVLADFPSNEPARDASGKRVVINGVPQVVMYKVLKSPNATTIRHKDDIPGASGMAGTVPPPRVSVAPTGGGDAYPGTAGSPTPTAGNVDTCPHCGARGKNPPPRPYTCQRCGKSIN